MKKGNPKINIKAVCLQCLSTNCEHLKITHSFILTRRELTIIKAGINGQSNKEIGKELGLTCGTVKIYLNTIYRKLNLNKVESNRVKLILWARDHKEVLEAETSYEIMKTS